MFLENPYELLRVKPGATQAELRAAYRQRVLEVHPDKAGSGSVDLCQRVVAAFERLASLEGRRQPDAKQKAARAATRAATPPAPPPAKRPRGRASPCTSHAQSPKVAAAPKRAARPQSRPQCRAASSGTGFLARLVVLLRRLPAEQRRQVISQRLSQDQRLAMENFMRSEACPGTSGKPPSKPEPKQGTSSRRARTSSSGAGKATCKAGQPAPMGTERINTHIPAIPATGPLPIPVRQTLAADLPTRASLVPDNGLQQPVQQPKKVVSERPRADSGRPTGTGSVRGIVRTTYGDHTYYRAQVGFLHLTLRCKWRRLLAQAVEDHLLLMSLKLHILAVRDGVEGYPLEEKLRAAVAKMSADHSIQLEELGLSICAFVAFRFSHHLVGQPLSSPTYSWRDLSLAAKAWRRIQEASGWPAIQGILASKRTPANNLQDFGWESIRSALLETWSERGADVHEMAHRLDGLAAARASLRCTKKREALERSRMAQEEHNQRIVERLSAANEARRRRIELREIRECERREQRSMAAEDWLRLRRRRRTGGVPNPNHYSETQDEKVVLRFLETLLQRWEAKAAVLTRKRRHATESGATRFPKLCNLPAKC
mmetsp:Transcript_47730/g.103873  ORF Transcript_47730/g.103873 Transcript_47730/m.103873 type:complete len:601 (-) Transcript_47730:53-1855(-)